MTSAQTDEITAAKRIVFRRLAIRSYATQELRKILTEKGISEDTAEVVIAECIELGYCNDIQWIADFVRSHQARKMGPRAILMKLKARGINEELIEHAREHLEESPADQESIHKLLTTKYRTRNLADFKERQKVIAALMRRGFDLEEIKKAITG
jgi:regulatory protein